MSKDWRIKWSLKKIVFAYVCLGGILAGLAVGCLATIVHGWKEGVEDGLMVMFVIALINLADIISFRRGYRTAQKELGLAQE